MNLLFVIFLKEWLYIVDLIGDIMLRKIVLRFRCISLLVSCFKSVDFTVYALCLGNVLVFECMDCAQVTF